MLMPPQSLGFNYVTGNVLTTRPAAAFGTSVTPAQNAYGSYAQLVSGANVARDCYGVLINVNSIAATTAAKGSLTTIGIDAAGGTSYTDLIPHLLTGQAGTYLQGGHWYYFPVFIPSGSSVAAKGSVNNATVGTQNVAIWLYGAPSHLESLIYGHAVEAVGVVTASSGGTSVTEGTTSEGSWTSLGTTGKKWVFAQTGLHVHNGAYAGGTVHDADLSYGDGTNQILTGFRRGFPLTSQEDFNTMERAGPDICSVPSGATIYGRIQCSSTAVSGLEMAAYGVY